ncbi:MAG TPA: hypothetical protein PKJ33_04030 [Alphaproteobacteria bacterium]|nr:hypothetical protein [Alphaproteobacteria bacterium]
MNIFIMVLVFLFMAGYYLIDSPNQTVMRQKLEPAVEISDLRSIAECTAFAHTAAIKNSEFKDVCTQQYQIVTKSICLNEKQDVIKCDSTPKKNKTSYNFIVTSTENLPEDKYNSMMEILERDYKNSGTFGIFIDDFILSGNSGKREIPKGISKTIKLSNGQLIYITQYEIPDIQTSYETEKTDDTNCSLGTVKAYRFGRWQCVSVNEKTTCNGDKIWDSDTEECVADNSRKPLCASKQTAVLVDDVWECVDPFSDKTCPTGQIAKLNYNDLVWECVENPTTTETTKNCTEIKQTAVYGSLGSTLRISSGNCTDCEKMVTDSDTCVSKCVPDTTKLNDSKCYANADECTGSHKAFYFGFPNSKYVANISVVSGYTVLFDISHSQNRKFNCLDCGSGFIDTEKSLSPYVAVCNK